MDLLTIPEDKINDKVFLTKHLLKLIKEQSTVSEKITVAKNNFVDEEKKEIDYQSSLWLKTDFKKLGYTNKELREAYMKKKLNDYISTKNKFQNEFKQLERDYDILTRMIKITTILLSQVVEDVRE